MALHRHEQQHRPPAHAVGYKRVYPLLSPHLHDCQFGGRQGVSTAHATQTFLNDMDTDTTWEAIYAFDMYHALDSPPKILIREVLDRMGTPPKLLLLVQTVLEYGSTFIRGAPDEVFRTTQGVKQGCPLSCFLFVLVLKIPLRFLASQGVVLSAFVDDVSIPIPPKTGPHTATLVQRGLNLIGCQLNVSKSECLPTTSPQPPPPSLLKYSQPLHPIQAGPSFWSHMACESLPDWADTTVHPMSQVSHLMHLGHPLPACFHQKAGYKVIADELLSQLAYLSAHPIRTLDRVLLVNTVILPRLLYESAALGR